MAAPRVSFIVVNYNGGDMLGRCLASIGAQTLRDFELIVVDNGSSDGSHERIDRSDPRLHCLRFEENLGFAEANNRALTRCRGQYVALVNNDVTLHPDWSAALVVALDADPTLGAAAGRIVQMRDPSRLDSAGFEFFSCTAVFDYRGQPAHSMTDASYLPFGAVGSAALYRRSAIDRVGAFHPEYFCYYEDTDLAVRLVLFGYGTVYVPQAVAEHLGSATGRRQSDFHVYHLRRNCEYLFWVDMVGPLALTQLPFHALYELAAFVDAAARGQGAVVLRAKRDALRELPFIARERRKLAHALESADGVGRATQRLQAKMKVGFPLPRIKAWIAKRLAASGSAVD